VKEKGGMEEAGGGTIRMAREGTTWSGLMTGLWTNLLYQKPREVRKKSSSCCQQGQDFTET